MELFQMSAKSYGTFFLPNNVVLLSMNIDGDRGPLTFTVDQNGKRFTLFWNDRRMEVEPLKAGDVWDDTTWRS